MDSVIIFYVRNIVTQLLFVPVIELYLTIIATAATPKALNVALNQLWRVHWYSTHHNVNTTNMKQKYLNVQFVMLDHQ